VVIPTVIHGKNIESELNVMLVSCPLMNLRPSYTFY
jgi:hypothetical protein